MKKLFSIILALFFVSGSVFAQATLADAQLIDKTGVDFTYYWYVGTQDKQIVVDSDGDVHVTYTKAYVTESDTGYQVMYQNLTDGVSAAVPVHETEGDDPVKYNVSWIGGGKDGTPVYVTYSIGGRGYAYGPAMQNQAMAKVNDAGDGLDELGVQNDAFYYGDPHYSITTAMEVDNAEGIIHVTVTNPSGWEFGYFNFDGSVYGEVWNLSNANPGASIPGKALPPRHGRTAATEGLDLAVNSNGSEVTVVSLHPFNQIWVHKGSYGGELWADDLFTGMDDGTCVPLFDTTQAIDWLTDLHEANAARPYQDVQVEYDENDQLVVVYTATYREHWLDTTSGGRPGYDGWWRTHGTWPGDWDGVYYDGSTKAKPQIMVWNEASGVHSVVTESIYPMAGETFEWFAFGEADSGFGMWGGSYSEGLISNLCLIKNSEAAEGEPKYVLLFKQMNSPYEQIVDGAAFSDHYYMYKNDLFSMTSDDGSTWSNLLNLTETADLDENDVSGVIDNGTLHVMWRTDNLGGRDRVLVYTPDYADRFYTYSGHQGFGYQIRTAEEDQCEFLYKAVPLDVVSAVEDVTIPGKFELAQNYPNPFNPSTTISYALPARSDVNIKVYNNLGQLVTTLFNGVNEAGTHEVVWNAADLSSGVYFYTINAGDFVATKKMILLK
ncbi:MAG: T9SS type A sorting domain-containing protein [Bacteroidota bacterium]